MVLSKYIQQIIDQNRQVILSDVPFKDILIRLHGVHVLSDVEVERLQQCDNHESAGFKFLKILKSRNNTDFIKFCDLLINSQIENVRKLGLELKNAATEKEQASGQSNLV